MNKNQLYLQIAEEIIIELSPLFMIAIGEDGLIKGLSKKGYTEDDSRAVIRKLIVSGIILQNMYGLTIKEKGIDYSSVLGKLFPSPVASPSLSSRLKTWYSKNKKATAATIAAITIGLLIAFLTKFFGWN